MEVVDAILDNMKLEVDVEVFTDILSQTTKARLNKQIAKSGYKIIGKGKGVSAENSILGLNTYILVNNKDKERVYKIIPFKSKEKKSRISGKYISIENIYNEIVINYILDKKDKGNKIKRPRLYGYNIITSNDVEFLIIVYENLYIGKKRSSIGDKIYPELCSTKNANKKLLQAGDRLFNYSHKLKLIHGDIKMDNICIKYNKKKGEITDLEFYLLDFGSSSIEYRGYIFNPIPKVDVKNVTGVTGSIKCNLINKKENYYQFKNLPNQYFLYYLTNINPCFIDNCILCGSFDKLCLLLSLLIYYFKYCKEKKEENEIIDYIGETYIDFPYEKVKQDIIQMIKKKGKQIFRKKVLYDLIIAINFKIPLLKKTQTSKKTKRKVKRTLKRNLKRTKSYFS